MNPYQSDLYTPDARRDAVQTEVCFSAFDRLTADPRREPVVFGPAQVVSGDGGTLIRVSFDAPDAAIVFFGESKCAGGAPDPARRPGKERAV